MIREVLPPRKPASRRDVLGDYTFILLVLSAYLWLAIIPTLLACSAQSSSHQPSVHPRMWFGGGPRVDYVSRCRPMWIRPRCTDGTLLYDGCAFTCEARQ